MSQLFTLFSRTASLLLLALLSVPAPAQAGLVTYGIDYTVEYIVPKNGPSNVWFDSAGAVGNHYFGSFTVDDAILATDGLNKPGVFVNFFTQIEGTIWNSSLRYPLSDFSGFYGADGSFGSPQGFNVVGGEIVSVQGGVYGRSDLPFIDFFTPNDFYAIMPMAW